MSEAFNPNLIKKARNVEYRDPKDEEWEKFQKIIQEETKVNLLQFILFYLLNYLLIKKF